MTFNALYIKALSKVLSYTKYLHLCFCAVLLEHEFSIGTQVFFAKRHFLHTHPDASDLLVVVWIFVPVCDWLALTNVLFSSFIDCEVARLYRMVEDLSLDFGVIVPLSLGFIPLDWDCTFQLIWESHWLCWVCLLLVLCKDKLRPVWANKKQ